MSYEDALAEPEDMGALRGEKELSNTELSAPMQSGAFLATCNAPDAMKVTVKVAVRDGRVMGVTVVTDPDDTQVAECVDKAVREIPFPQSKRRDSIITTY